MKNTEETSVNAVSTQVKKEGEKKEVKEAKEEGDDEEDDDEEDDDEEDDDEEEAEDEENTEHRNEMFFYLESDTSYRIWAEGRWLENTAGEVVGDADIYFHHILTGRRCESVRDCFQGWTEPDKEVSEKWETLCQHIEELDSLEEIICTEESFGV